MRSFFDGWGCVCGNGTDNIRPCHTCFAYYFEQAKSLHMISHGGFEFLFFYFTCFILLPETRNACSEISIIGVSLTESV